MENKKINTWYFIVKNITNNFDHACSEFNAFTLDYFVITWKKILSSVKIVLHVTIEHTKKIEYFILLPTEN